MSEKNESVKPEIVAAITAAVQAMLGKGVVAVKIKRSDAWAMAGRNYR